MKFYFLMLAFVVIIGATGCGQNATRPSEAEQNSSIGEAARNATSGKATP